MAKRITWIEDLECTEITVTNFVNEIHSGNMDDITDADLRELETSASHLRQIMRSIRERCEATAPNDYAEHRISAFEALGIRNRL